MSTSGSLFLGAEVRSETLLTLIGMSSPMSSLEHALHLHRKRAEFPPGQESVQ